MHRITLLGSHEKELREYLESHPENHERAAIVLFKRLHSEFSGLEKSDRFISIDIILFEDNWINSSSTVHIDFKMAYLRDTFQRVDVEKLVFCFVHNHPDDIDNFSSKDDSNELTLLQALTNRNGQNISFISLLLVNGIWKGRFRSGRSPNNIEIIRHISIISNRLVVYPHGVNTLGDLYKKQIEAFGDGFVNILQSLRVGVIGAGGTGSPVVTLLARSGIGEIVIVDQDTIEHSNLNRLRGAGSDDVDKNKALTLKNYIDKLKLKTKVYAIESNLDDNPIATDAISTCDIVFGCTDAFIGREVMNAALYAYLLAYIDIGLGGQIVVDKYNNPLLKYHFGRISTILPEYGECLFCQGVVNEKQIQREYVLRQNPNLSEEEAKQKYIENTDTAAPGIGPFTSSTADYGLMSLYDLIKPMWKLSPELRRDLITVDFIKMDIRSKQSINNKDCPYCGLRAFFNLSEHSRARLNRTNLGKREIYV